MYWKKNTVIIVDTCQVFHRGKEPENSNRETMFFYYNSKEPLFPEFCQRLFNAKDFKIQSKELTLKQKESIS